MTNRTISRQPGRAAPAGRPWCGGISSNIDVRVDRGLARGKRPCFSRRIEDGPDVKPCYVLRRCRRSGSRSLWGGSDDESPRCGGPLVLGEPPRRTGLLRVWRIFRRRAERRRRHRRRQRQRRRYRCDHRHTAVPRDGANRPHDLLRDRRRLLLFGELRLRHAPPRHLSGEWNLVGDEWTVRADARRQVQLQLRMKFAHLA
jgi:hypothetical protein